MSKQQTKSILHFFLILLGLWLLLELVVKLMGEILWFQEVDYLKTFYVRIFWQLGLGIGGSVLSGVFLWGNLHLAQRWQWQTIPEISRSKFSNYYNKERKQTITMPHSSEMRLSGLLFWVIGSCVWISFMLLYQGIIAVRIWRENYRLIELYPFDLNWIWRIVAQLPANLWQIGIIITIILLVLNKTEEGLKIIAVAFSLLFGLILAGNWTEIIKYFQPTIFAQSDPQFHKDISFYVFNLPIWQLFNFWLGGLCLAALLGVSLTYLLSADSLSMGKFPGFSRLQLRHLYALWGGLMGLLVLHHLMRRYRLLYSVRGVVYGANYTDVNVQQYVEIGLGIIAGISAIWLLKKAMTDTKSPYKLYLAEKKARFRTLPFYLVPISLYLLVCGGGLIISVGVQNLIVQPNELVRERPFIERSIDYTRAAFALNKIEAKVFNPKAELTPEILAENHLTIDNIRLWDTIPLLETNRQLQQIRLYYQFPDADIDRYTISSNRRPSEKQQVIISARELDYNAVPTSAKTWVNQHLVYTHGYGFTLSPVNLVDEGGLPYYFVKDIGTTEDQGALKTANELIQSSIPIGKPRIYYGELTNTYVMTSTKAKELDFPSGEGNVYNTYDGLGGILLNFSWRRWLFAQYLKDWQMLFTKDFTPQTKLLFRRNIKQRVQMIAPFLNYDRNPYLVAADVGEKESKLYWIMDAYTTSDRYPYSDPGQDKFNYIRNSVKVVVDAYNGDVDFYIADASDPIIETWNKIFPQLFQSLSNMPSSLRSHIRYPEDLFSIQSERLLNYHMTDPQVFYNREDQWEIPQEIYGTETQAVAPYYLIMKFPEATQEEFILLQPYTPTSRPNLIAWLAARSDNPSYGKLLLYKFPKQRLVLGTNQVEALINQNPQISQQISLWNRQGSRALQGHLLVIPIEQSLLYVEPLYLVAEENGVPTLARVIVVYENRIVMRETLQEALNAIFAQN